MTHSEFVDKVDIISTASSYSQTPLSWETFRPEPATRQFDWSFAPIPTSCQWVEHQYDSAPQPRFAVASSRAGIVHCLSGPISITCRFLAGGDFTSFASLYSKSPWSVFQYGSDVISLRPNTFTFHSLDEIFSTFVRTTSSLSVSVCI